MKIKKRGLKDFIELVYLSWGFSVNNKTWQNGSKSKSPILAEHRMGKKIFIEILEKPCKKKEKELAEFYQNENYKIIYLSDFSEDLKSLFKKLKKTLGANPVKLRHEMPLLRV